MAFWASVVAIQTKKECLVQFIMWVTSMLGSWGIFFPGNIYLSSRAGVSTVHKAPKSMVSVYCTTPNRQNQVWHNSHTWYYLCYSYILL